MSDFESNGLMLVSFDGGGVRGLSSLIILRRILYQIQKKNKLKTMPLPCEYFDMMAGTGTGGLIALMLGRLRMSIDEAIKTYLEVAEHVFKEGKRFGEAKFKASNLEKMIKDVISRATQDRETPLKDNKTQGQSCKTFVCSFNKDSPGPRNVNLFRTYDHPTEQGLPCAIWEAARATSAVPTLFKAMNIAGLSFIAGGTIRSNPTELLLGEAKAIFPNRRFYCVLSLGTGKFDSSFVPHQNFVERNLPNPMNLIYRVHVPFTVVKAIISMSADCELTHDTVNRVFELLEMPDTYFRFNVDSGLQNVKASDWEKHGYVDAVTQRYLETRPVELSLSKVVDLMAKKEVDHELQLR